MKTPDPFYRSPEWQVLRTAVLKRDKWRCTVPGCPHTVRTSRLTVDHIKARRDGGADEMPNLRTLCRDHDNQVKEGADGVRANGGKTFVRGCDADGWPLDSRRRG